MLLRLDQVAFPAFLIIMAAILFSWQAMAKLRVGILDFYNIQIAQRKSSVISRSKSRILQKSRRGFSLLSGAIRKLGAMPVIYHPEHCQIVFQRKNSKILYRGKEIKGCDVLIPRINVIANVELEISLIRQFQAMGIPVVNDYLSIAKGLNKLLTLQALTKEKIKVPRTVVVRKFQYLDRAIELVGGYPVIVKSVFGTHGKGVAIIESRRSLFSALDLLWKYNSSAILLIQEYVAEADNIDYRAFVIGGRVVAAMERKAPQGDFRSNLNLGGNGKAVKLTKQESETVIRATRILGLDTCGVDFLRTLQGSVIMEMNPCAGLAGIMKATSVDIADKLVAFALQKIH